MSLYSDVNEVITSSLQIEKIKSDDISSITNEDGETKHSDMEIAHQEETNQRNIEDGNKDTSDEYHHSLWKWPSGRSKLTKVIIQCHHSCILS